MTLGQICTRLRFQELEPLVETHEDLARRKQLDPCCRQLERKWQPVEAPAELGYRIGVQLRQLEVHPHIAGAIDEQAHRFRASETTHLQGA